MVKLSPNAPSLSAVALACVKAGADALSLVNTFKAMAIDIENQKPVFDGIIAGLSGPAIKPIALHLVWELYDTLKESKTQVPIVGIGGIANANDAVEYLMAGATAVQIGSSTFVNPHTMSDVIDGLRRYMKSKSLLKLGEISLKEAYGKNY